MKYTVYGNGTLKVSNIVIKLVPFLRQPPARQLHRLIIWWIKPAQFVFLSYCKVEFGLHLLFSFLLARRLRCLYLSQYFIKW